MCRDPTLIGIGVARPSKLHAPYKYATLIEKDTEKVWNIYYLVKVLQIILRVRLITQN